MKKNTRSAKKIRKVADTWDAEHPARKKAIRIMEFISEWCGRPKMFDCKNGNPNWYDVEDAITNIIIKK